MKLKAINYVSAVCYFLSSASLLSISFFNVNDGNKAAAIFFGIVFWSGFLIGTILQIILWSKTRLSLNKRNLKVAKLLVGLCFTISFIVAILVLSFFETNIYALPITLFMLLLNAEMYCFIKRMERL